VPEKEEKNYITSKSSCEGNNNFKKLQKMHTFFNQKESICQFSFCTEITYAEIVLIGMPSTDKL
jgi:hypothetical protein